MQACAFGGGAGKRSVLLELKMQRHVPPFGELNGVSVCAMNQPIELVRAWMMNCGTEKGFTAVLVTSLFCGVKGRWEMVALAVLGLSRGGLQWDWEPKSWWDSAWSCGDVAQRKQASWRKRGLVFLLLRWRLLARLVSVTTCFLSCLFGVLPSPLKFSPIWW